MTSSPHQHSISAPEPKHSTWSAFAIVLSAGFMTLLDVSIVNVALPSIESTLHSTSTNMQWIVAGYSLAFGLTLIPAGRIGDLFGRRTIFIIGVIAFTLASMACGFATSATMLAIFRVFQGAAAGILNPQTVGLIQQLFGPADRPKAFGYLGGIIGVSTAVGPTLGGILVSGLGPEYGWRAVFLINLPLGLIVPPLAKRFLPGPDTPPKSPTPTGPTSATLPASPRQKLNLDSIGLILIGLSVLTAMWPFVSTEQGKLTTAPWWMLAVSLVIFLLFMGWERRCEAQGRPALLTRSLTRNTSFILGLALGATYFAGFTSFFIVLTLYLQQGLGLPAWMAGLMQVPIAAASALTSSRSGAWVLRWGRKVVLFSTLLTITGIGIVSTVRYVPVESALWVILVGNIFMGLGQGGVISPNQALSLQHVDSQQGGVAGALLQTVQRVSAAVGLAVLTMLFFSTLQARHVSGLDLSSHSRAELADHYGAALQVTLLVTVGIIGVAAIIALIDSVRTRKLTDC